MRFRVWPTFVTSTAVLFSCQHDRLVGRMFSGSPEGGTGGASEGDATGGAPNLGPGGDGGGESLVCTQPCRFPTHRCLSDECVRVLPERSYALGNTTICLEQEGRIVCAGQGSSGELGVGEPVSQRSSFLPTESPEPLVFVVGGVGNHFMGFAESGGAFAWGSNYAGGLGLGDTNNRLYPSAVPGLGEETFLEPGSGHSCFLSRDGKLSCAGRNVDGELGVGDTTDRWDPVEIAGAYAQVAVGWGHTCALSHEGELYCWGLNDVGQLGVGDQETRVLPTRVGDQRFRFISAEVKRTCAIDNLRVLYCWGDNEFGQAGVGSRDLVLSPTRTLVDADFNMVSGGSFGVCGVTVGGELYCWGKPPEDLTNTASSADLLLPALITNDSDFTWVLQGYGNACAQRVDASIWCWGRNQAGQFALGDVSPRNDPVLVAP